jgi:hypothetical protein
MGRCSSFVPPELVAFREKAADRLEHERRVDYRYGFAEELYEGDGLRFLVWPGKPVPFDLTGPLVVHKVERLGDLVSVTVYDRGVLVDDLLYGVSAPVHSTVVMAANDPLLIRY